MRESQYEAIRECEAIIGLERADITNMPEWERREYQKWLDDLASTVDEDYWQ